MLHRGLFNTLRYAFIRAAAAKCHSVATDKLTPPGGFYSYSSGLSEAGKADSAKNLLGEVLMPFGDTECGFKRPQILFGRTSPVGSYTNAPMGSLFYYIAAADGDANVYIKKTGGWEIVETAGAIAVYGSDGVYKKSYTTIDLAIAGLANSDILMIKQGEYTLTGAVDITKTDCKIIGVGDVTIVGAADADYCFKTVFGAITSTKGITFKNITIDHGDDATQIGIEIANVSATGRINAYLTDVSFESDGGNSIQVDHSVTTASVRLYVVGGTIEGPASYTVKNTDDRIRFEGSTLRGGLVTSADDIAMEIELWNCKVLHEGVTGGHASQLLYAAYCLSETDANPNVYAALDTSDLAGSHTESLLFPTS